MEKSKSFPGHYSNSYSDILSAFDDRSKSYSFNGPSVNNIDDFANSGNPEVKRRKRVAQYNMYTKEGKLKSSFRNSFKWMKSKFVDTYYDEWSIWNHFMLLYVSMYGWRSKKGLSGWTHQRVYVLSNLRLYIICTQFLNLEWTFFFKSI